MIITPAQLQSKTTETWRLELDFGRDMTGWTFACQWRPTKDSAMIAATAAFDLDEIESGFIVAEVSDTQATTLGTGKWFWDVRRTDGSRPIVWPEGTIELIQGVTR